MRFPATILLILFSIYLHGQISGPPPIQFGTIPPADLQMRVYEQDTTAEAVVLCDFEKADVAIVERPIVKKEHHRRIKILNKNGFGYGDIEIPFYSYKSKEQFFFGEAAIYFPDGSSEKLGKKDIFIEKTNEYWSKARFTFPKMEVGCVIEYIYYINSERFYQPEDWFFQEAIPVRHSEIRLGHHPMLEYTFFFQGNEGMKTKTKEKDLTVLEGRNGTCTILPGIYIFENAPAMRRESYITTMNDYRARIRFQLAQINHHDGWKEKVTDTWENFRKELEASEYFGHHFLKKGHYKDIVDEVAPAMKALSTQQDKAAYAYHFITKKISWDGRHTIYAGSEKIKELFEKGSGSSAQINLMLLVLLREAGIEAAPVLTSTRTHGKMYEEYPIEDQFNHTLLLAEINGQPMFLDATEPLRPMGYPDVEALNGRGWHLEKGWMDIGAPSESVDVFISELTLSGNGHLTGQITGAYKGYNAIPERKAHLKDPDGKHWEKRLSEKFTDVKIGHISTNHLHEIDQAFSDTVQFTIHQAATVSEGFIYFSPIVHAGFKENPFKQKERNYPVDFPYSIREQHNIKVNLPEGYVVEELPENVRVSLDNKGGSFFFAASNNAPGILTFNISLNVKQLKYYPEEYPAVKQLFDLFVGKIGEQVVLRAE